MINSYIFPFHEVEKGSKIILYGAGRMGKDYYWQIISTGYCEIVGWMDSSFSYDSDMQYPFCSFSQLKELEYDFLVISVQDPDVAIYEIFPRLLEEGCAEEKIKYFARSPVYEEHKRIFFRDQKLNFPRKRTKEENFLCTQEMCVGCFSCYNACPVKAISMEPDKLGFMHPNIEEEKCISCRNCSDVCPVLSDRKEERSCYPEIYYAMADDKLRKQGASGGLFPLLAQQFIKENGVVFGAAFDEEMRLVHTCAFSEKELPPLYKSKYVESYIGDSFGKIKDLLIEGRRVLFCGTPCQVAGLNTFLGKEKEHLFTIDLYCHGVPSQKMLLDFIREKFGDREDIEEIAFRNKEYGWRGSVDCIDVRFSDGLWKQIYEDNEYMSAYMEYLSLRSSCYHCKFSLSPRVGDLSLGDAWGTKWCPKDREKELGISLVSVNSLKGVILFDGIKSQLEVQKTHLMSTKRNSVYALKRMISEQRAIWKNLYPAKGFSESYHMVTENHYDIGLVGGYSWSNYGDEITYYALYYLLSVQWKKKVLMVTWTKDSFWPVYQEPILFQNTPYPPKSIAPEAQQISDLKRLNQYVDCFLIASGQYVKPSILRKTKDLQLLEWVSDCKKKIAYSVSWGHDTIRLTNRARRRQSEAFQRFDAFAVREQSGVKIAKEEFGVSAEWVLDPVFLCDRAMYDDLIGVRKLKQKEIFGYILDPSIENEQIVRYLTEKMKLPYEIISAGSLSAQSAKTLWDLDVIESAQLESFLLHLRDAEYVLTDSFHATCLAIIFKKQFSTIVNSGRGTTRYESLLEYLGLTSRLLYQTQDVQDTLERQMQEKIDYKKVDVLIDKMRDKSIKWLRDQIGLF